MPTTRPKLWNIGKALNTVSVTLMVSIADICLMLEIMLAWLKTTAFGAPSDPDVNRITALRLPPFLIGTRLIL